MKKALSYLAAVCLVAQTGVAQALTVECLPMYNVFYAGLENQPVLRIKLTAEEGEKVLSLNFTTGNTSLPGDITGAHLYSTGSIPFFAPHAAAENAPVEKATSDSAAAGQIIFNPAGGVELAEGVHYLWLTYDIASTAKGNHRIAANCLSVIDGKGNTILPEVGKDGTARRDAVVYPFKYRVAPYYRPKWISDWNKNHLTSAHFKYATDFIFFGLTNNGGEVGFQWGVTQEIHDSTLARVKQLRGKTECHLVAGFAVSELQQPAEGKDSFGKVISDTERREKLAKSLASYVLENGFEGLDLDYEYPTPSGGSWWNFALFLTNLREELAGTGVSLSIAITVRYDKPLPVVYDQVDFVNLMTYGAPGDHSTMALVESDLAWCNGKVPPVKTMLGLPFFSRDRLSPHSDGGGLGYSAILNQYPTIAANKNVFINKSDNNKEHYFNGATLIKQKCKLVVQRKLGGVLIWAYDTDALITNSRSLAKAMYSVIKQAKR